MACLIIQFILWLSIVSLQACQALLVRNPTTSRIPQQIIFTGWPERFERLRDEEKANIEHTMSLNSELQLRYLGDIACYNYLQEFFNTPFVEFHNVTLADIYKHEKMGMFRGDICRAAVLAREGGYYSDLDVAFVKPFSQLVPPHVDFASSVDLAGKGVLNAIMAATQGHPIIDASLHKLVIWYEQATSRISTFPGVDAMQMALKAFHNQNCPDVNLTPPQANIVTCGNHKTRMFRERLCKDTPSGCPAERSWYIQQCGIYDGNNLVAWSRYESCMEWGCRSTGHQQRSSKLSLLQESSWLPVGPHGTFGWISAPQS